MPRCVGGLVDWLMDRWVGSTVIIRLISVLIRTELGSMLHINKGSKLKFNLCFGNLNNTNIFQLSDYGKTKMEGGENETKV